MSQFDPVRTLSLGEFSICFLLLQFPSDWLLILNFNQIHAHLSPETLPFCTCFLPLKRLDSALRYLLFLSLTFHVEVFNRPSKVS